MEEHRAWWHLLSWRSPRSVGSRSCHGSSKRMPLGCSLSSPFGAGLTPATCMQTLVLLSEADRAEVSRFAKNFLPILFNLYGQPVAAGDTPAPRRAVLETVKTYLTITDPQVSWWRRGRSCRVSEGWDGASSTSWMGWKGLTHRARLDLCHLRDRPPDTSGGWVKASEWRGAGLEKRMQFCDLLLLFISLFTPSLLFIPLGVPVGEQLPGKSQ